MRQPYSSTLAGTAVLALVLLGTSRGEVATQAATQGAKPDGKKLFLAHGCQMCHSVPAQGIVAKARSEKMRGPDVASIEAERAALGRYLRGQVDKNGVLHMKVFKGTDEQLDALVAWILDQK